MSPYLGVLFGYPIPVFALALDAAALAGVALAGRLAARRGVPWTRFLDVALWTLAAGLCGARLGYVALHWPEFAANPLTALSVWEGGLTLLGAITVGAPASLLALRRSGLPAGTMLDAGATGLALAQTLGGLGCIPAGCAAGVALPQATFAAPLLPDAAGVLAPRFPSQLVEAAAEGMLCLFLLWLWRRRAGAPAGGVACAYLALYGTLRLVLEPFRGDSVLIGPVAAASVWSITAIAVAAACHLRLRRAARRRMLAPPALREQSVGAG